MIRNLKRSYHQLQKQHPQSSPQPEPQNGIVRSGHAVVVTDKETGGVKWHSFGMNDDIGQPFEINQPLSFPPTMFKVGTRIEIFEDTK